MNMDSPELVSNLSSLLETMRALEQRDYSTGHQDDGWIIAWKELRPDAMNDELCEIAEMVLQEQNKGENHKRIQEDE